MGVPLRRRGSVLTTHAADALSRRVREIYATGRGLSNRVRLVQSRQNRLIGPVSGRARSGAAVRNFARTAV